MQGMGVNGSNFAARDMILHDVGRAPGIYDSTTSVLGTEYYRLSIGSHCRRKLYSWAIKENFLFGSVD